MNETLDEIKKLLIEHNARISCGHRWLCAYVDTVGDTVYTVYQKKPYAKVSQIVYEGTSFSSALDFVGRD